MSDISNHPNSVYFRIDLEGQSTQSLRNENKTKKKYKSNEASYKNDNGPVAFGQAFKRFMK